MVEEWKPIPGYEDRYEVSNLGRARSVSILNPWLDRDGYSNITVRDQGGKKNLRLARSILAAFVGHPEPGYEARHLNDLPSDNRLVNLVWGTRQQNTDDRKRNGGYPDPQPKPPIKPTHNAVKTHCIHGHEFTPENTYINNRKSGKRRVCKTCHQRYK